MYIAKTFIIILAVIALSAGIVCGGKPILKLDEKASHDPETLKAAKKIEQEVRSERLKQDAQESMYYGRTVLFPEIEKEYESFRLAHIKRVFVLQYWFSIMIFVMVVFLVFLGVYLSYLQFKKSLDISSKQQDPQTELSISKEGLKIKSSVLGLLVLVISLAFFGLYMKYVYPINVVSLTPPKSQQHSAQVK